MFAFTDKKSKKVVQTYVIFCLNGDSKCDLGNKVKTLSVSRRRTPAQTLESSFLKSSVMNNCTRPSENVYYQSLNVPLSVGHESPTLGFAFYALSTTQNARLDNRLVMLALKCYLLKTQYVTNILEIAPYLCALIAINRLRHCKSRKYCIKWF